MSFRLTDLEKMAVRVAEEAANLPVVLDRRRQELAAALAGCIGGTDGPRRRRIVIWSAAPPPVGVPKLPTSGLWLSVGLRDGRAALPGSGKQRKYIP